MGLWGQHLHKNKVLPERRNNLVTARTNHTHTPGQLFVPRSHRRFSHRPVIQTAPTILHGLFCQSHSSCACNAVCCQEADSQSICSTISKYSVELSPYFKCHWLQIQRSSKFDSRTLIFFFFIVIIITSTFLSSYR